MRLSLGKLWFELKNDYFVKVRKGLLFWKQETNNRHASESDILSPIGLAVSQSTSLVQIGVSQQLLDGLPQNIVFFILMTLDIL